MLYINQAFEDTVNNIKTFNEKLYIYLFLVLLAVVSFYFKVGLEATIIYFVSLLYAFMILPLLIDDTILNIWRIGVSKIYIIFLFIYVFLLIFMIKNELVYLIFYTLFIGVFLFLLRIVIRVFLK
ncbi:hypothetical protein [Arcobacter sp.]|uniref:hypothetical protein n=1 Tax=Arcobacter sp. TaxID=1872629 RepID=UPI003D0ADEF3